LTVIAAATALAATLTACNRSADANPTPTIGTCTDCTTAATATGSATSTTTDAAAHEQADRAAATDVWRKFINVTFTIDDMPPDQVDAAVKAVAVEPPLSLLLKKRADALAAGQGTYGVPVSYVLWPQPINAATTAILLDCQDGSQAGSLDTKTGNKLGVGTVNTPIQGTLSRTTDGWRVASSELLKGKTCTPGG